MRIAYVAVHLGEQTVRGGVGRKINTQLQMWQEAGHEAKLFLHTQDSIELPGAAIYWFHTGLLVPVLKSAARELARSRALAKMIAQVATFRPDVIYLRFGLFAYPLQRIFKIAPVVLELNSKDLDEYRFRGPFFFHLNRLTRGITLDGARGWAAVSEEIVRFPENQPFHKACRVIANGIDTQLLEPLPPAHNTRPVLAFAGSPGYSWHGVDKLVRLAAGCPDIHFDVIGYQADQVEGPVPANMTFHGFVKQAQMRSLLGGADAAFGTMALHRKSMDEASPLKVREAIGFGLPLILAFHDTDLSGQQFDFILQIPNTEDNVETHAAQIREFAYRMMGRRVDREVIFPLIDQRIKEEARLEFFEQIMHASER